MGKHTGTPQVTRVFDDYSGTVISAPCSRYGDGQCDGYVYGLHEEPHVGDSCACSCHSGWEDIGSTLAEVEAWHAKQHRMYG